MVNADNSYVLAGICFTISFFVALILTKIWIRAARKFKLTGKDMNKIDGKEVAEAGGIAVLFGFLSGLLSYVFLKTFYLDSATHLIIIFVTITSVLLAGFVGFVDDILGWKKGLKQWQKPLLTLPIAVPLMVVNAGHTTISLPLFGQVNLGMLYPLVVIPLVIMGSSNGFNMFAGLNGLEAGMGTIILSVLGYLVFGTNPWVSLIAFCAVFALLGFLVFNKYPSKVFPGDSLTYSIGALIAIVAILGNVEKAGLILFAPYLIEFLIKAKNKFKSECFGIPQPDGTLKAPEKTGSLTHIFMRIFRTERNTVLGILFAEVLLGLLVLLIY